MYSNLNASKEAPLIPAGALAFYELHIKTHSHISFSMRRAEFSLCIQVEKYFLEVEYGV